MKVKRNSPIHSFAELTLVFIFLLGGSLLLSPLHKSGSYSTRGNVFSNRAVLELCLGFFLDFAWVTECYCANGLKYKVNLQNNCIRHYKKNSS